MRKLLIAAVAGVLATGSALAADLPARMPTKAAPAPALAYNWAGFYTASTIGGLWRDTEGNFQRAVPNAFNTDGSRAWWGSAVGLQGQWGNWVLGIEGSYSTPLFDNDFDTSRAAADCAVAPGTACETRLNSIWTVGGKAGYAFGNWMVYGTGGYASGRLQSRLVTNANGFIFSDTKEWHNGWYAGAGVDFYVTRFMWSDLILGVEYRHVELDSKTHLDPTGAVANNRNLDASIDMVMAKATFKWVGMGPLSMFAR
jgi:outer membrane immunogenic protein